MAGRPANATMLTPSVTDSLLRTDRTPMVLIVLGFLFLALGAGTVIASGNVALIGFSRQWDDPAGQVFALVVMVVAAAEVVIGLGLTVAVFRSRMNLDVDEMSSMKG